MLIRRVVGAGAALVLVAVLAAVGAIAWSGGDGDRDDDGRTPVDAPETTESADDGCPEQQPPGPEPAAPGSSAPEPPRLPPEAAEALAALAEGSPPLPCGAIAAAAEHTGHGEGTDALGGHGSGEHGTGEHGTGAAGGSAAVDAAELEAQWALAVAATPGLATPDQAGAAGYFKASPQVPGVGTHWIKWPLIDAPFDPARPSMLLFDETPGRSPRLAGFSYWLRSPTAPAGFAGTDDHWHQHFGLCFTSDGWMRSERVPTRERCLGLWFNGSDLWMLHAWVVPDLPNRAGRFAGRNDSLCPGDFARVADIVTCDPLR